MSATATQVPADVARPVHKSTAQSISETPPDLGPYHAAAAASSTADAFTVVFAWPGSVLGSVLTIHLLRYAAVEADALAYFAIAAFWMFYFSVLSVAWMFAASK